MGDSVTSRHANPFEGIRHFRFQRNSRKKENSYPRAGASSEALRAFYTIAKAARMNQATSPFIALRLGTLVPFGDQTWHPPLSVLLSSVLLELMPSHLTLPCLAKRCSSLSVRFHNDSIPTNKLLSHPGSFL